jgi:transcriptional regulator with XRE-family HTH domain
MRLMAEDVRQLVGHNVRRPRLAAGLSQAELAERMGVDRAHVSGLELGHRNPTIVTLWHVNSAGVGLGAYPYPQAMLISECGHTVYLNLILAGVIPKG